MSKVPPKAATRVLETYSGQFQPCTHHWVIETPAGPTSEGQCKKCGAQRNDFANWVEKDYFRDNETGLTFKGQWQGRL
jgi:hypothetical protein